MTEAAYERGRDVEVDGGGKRDEGAGEVEMFIGNFAPQREKSECRARQQRRT